MPGNIRRAVRAPVRENVRRRGISHYKVPDPLKALIMQHQPAQLLEMIPQQADEDLDDRLPEDELSSDDHSLDEMPGDDEDEPCQEEDELASFLEQTADPRAFLSPIIQESNSYRIAVIREKEKWRCSILKPAWMRLPLSGPYRLYARRLHLFMSALANWLQEECQGFLDSRQFAELCAGRDTDWYLRQKPCVTQDGLLETCNRKGEIPEDDQLKGDQVSRLLPKIFLVWEEEALPLGALCSSEAKVEWIKAGFLRVLRDRKDIPKRFGSLRNEDSKESLNTPGRMLKQLAHSAGISEARACEIANEIIDSLCTDGR